MDSESISPIEHTPSAARTDDVSRDNDTPRLPLIASSVEAVTTQQGVTHASVNSFQTVSTVADSFNQHSSQTALLSAKCPDPPAARKPIPRPSTYTLRGTIASWSFEIFAVFISKAAIVAAIAILRSYDNRPLSAWTFSLTLNTIIATLGTLARTTLAFAISACIGQQKWGWFRRRSDDLVAFERFDEASRGPWGGTRLFVWLRLRHWAALGALVTVGTLAFDPFLQAVITTNGRLDDIITEPGASIGNALRVDGGKTIKLALPPPINLEVLPNRPQENTNRPEFWLLSSIYNGLTNTTTQRSESTAFQCATGNCTWAPYVSAAVCNKCRDVSDTLEVTTGSGNDGSYIPNPSNIRIRNNFTNYLLPYASIRNWDFYFDDRDRYSGPNWWSYTTNGGRMYARTLMTANSTYHPKQTISFHDMETLVMAFVMLRAPDQWLNLQFPWNETRPVATECALYLCANAYNTTIQSNVLHEEILASWTNRDVASYAYTSNLINLENKTEALDAAHRIQLYDPKFDYERHDLRLTVPAEVADKWQLHTGSVNITQSFIGALSESLIASRGLDIKSRTNSSLMLFPDIYSSVVIDALWNSTNLTTTFDNVAKSITDRMRDLSPDRQPGKTQTWVTYVRVKWAYLAYPLSMLAFGILYVFCTIVESMSLRMPVWKEKALPTLIYGLNDETQRLLREREWDEDKEKSKDVSVRFKMDEKEGCMRLVAG
ncbi:hypothetical protein FB567DRAFT_598535 [Paraphoma chrysanthemicola]|uniref:Uncharacterized protein n=1 Tax=Paraphoma chrysanthemicola TaxID=798071 RepID=A0A8K0QUC9_9PLEO|nr:hypothetical protein FB567DRAFT_598535 [Paraphoma chrysanthemicola]